MGQPAKAVAQEQGPATHCILHGKALGWLSCTCYAVAMGIDKSSLHQVFLSGCTVRQSTGDEVGGTTLPQCAPIAEKHGIHIELHVGPRVCSTFYAAYESAAGRGFVLQGNTGALLKTKMRSTGGAVNHAIWVNNVGGGTPGDPEWADVYDPAADGRHAPWGTAPKGPQRWPWALVQAFAAALHPWGEADPRVLGPKKMYCGIFPDTEPHVHLKPAYNSAKTSPFPLKMKVKSPAVGKKVNARMGPRTSFPVKATLSNNSIFTAFQQCLGQKLDGSALWYGNHDGNLWVHSSGLIKA